MRYSGFPFAIAGLRANNTLCQTPLCPKRRPPRPQQPIFSVFHRGGLHFEHHTASSRGFTATKRECCIIRTPTRRQPSPHSVKSHRHRCGEHGQIGRAWLRCPWAAAGPGWDTHSNDEPHWCGGRRRIWWAWQRCPWAAAGPGRASRRRAEPKARGADGERAGRRPWARTAARPHGHAQQPGTPVGHARNSRGPEAPQRLGPPTHVRQLLTG